MHSVAHLIHAYGVLAVALVVGLECIGLPVPGETALLAAAMFAGTENGPNIIAVIMTAAVAAFLGRTIGYVIGREFHWLLVRYGNYLRISEGRIKLGQYLFLRHGGKIVLAAQFLPLLRTLAGIFAGVNVMPWRNFLLANAIGTFVWAVTYGYGAYALGRHFVYLQTPAVAITLALVVVIMFFVAGIFLHRHEAQLVAKAERAIPGPLVLPKRNRRADP